jgi:hypothetical protein
VVAKFGNATTGRTPSRVLLLRGARVEGSGGTRGIGKVSRLIVELGSRGGVDHTKKMCVGWELINLPKSTTVSKSTDFVPISKNPGVITPLRRVITLSFLCTRRYVELEECTF